MGLIAQAKNRHCVSRCDAIPFSTQEGAIKEQFRFTWVQWELYNGCLPTVLLLTETMGAINSWSSSLDNSHSPDSLFPVSYESFCVPSLGYENSHKNVLLLFLERGVYEQPFSQACLTFRNSNRKLRKLGVAFYKPTCALRKPPTHKVLL